MYIILLGAPGAGKGTLAKMIEKKFGISHLSTGDILRDNVNRKTCVGNQAKEYMNNGKLVPDDIMIQMVKGRVLEEDCKTGFVLDGFPRTIEQAEALELIFNGLNVTIDAVLNLKASQETIIERLSGRIICNGCEVIYHTENIPPKFEGKCDKCGDKLYQRDDDKKDVVKKRLIVYKTRTKKLISYYERQNSFYEIDANKKADEMFVEVCKNLEKVGKSG
ncbi:adenylate kinase [bacterium]|nr:adenylate kinase [bacterium]